MAVVQIRRLHPDARTPTYAHAGDAGADLYAVSGAVIGAGGGRAVIGTGLAIALPDGYAGLVLPRSGLARRHGVTCLNTPGLIDSGYRDEVRILLVNTDPDDDYEVRPGDRVAQLVVQPVAQVAFDEVEALGDSERGLGGFGSSGR